MTLRSLAPALFAMLLGACPTAASAASWGPAATVSGPGAVQPRLAVGAGGTAAIAYVAGGVWVVVRDQGQSWGAPVRVSKGNYNVRLPSVAVDGQGGVVVAWVQDSNPSGGNDPPFPSVNLRRPLTVRAAIRARSGSWGAVHQLGVTGHFYSDGPQVAANAAGEAIVLWGGAQANGTDPLHSSFRRAARPFGGVQTIDKPSPPKVYGRYVTALDVRGTAHATWNGAGGNVVITTRSRGGSGSWGAVRRVGRGTDPSIAVTPGRTAILAWRDAARYQESTGAQDGPLMAATRLPDGTLTAPQQVSATPVSGQSLAVARSGEAMLLSDASVTGAAFTLRFAVHPSAGGAFGAMQSVPEVAPGGAATYLADGTALYAWGGFSAVRPPGGIFGGAQEIATSPDTAGTVFGVGNIGNTAIVAFTRQLQASAPPVLLSADRR